ncbi:MULTISPECIES: nodulation protein NfeD [unclassified Shewanella]|uniref:NfeD family protein n=1 Tax=unclassified Shewanella TaxID=196818 RepID=UPI000C79E50B|nr:serine protease [Shewanella sp. GutDb-MelDb]PKG75830.1 serine protease [Shewanella sp. GutCb]
MYGWKLALFVTFISLLCMGVQSAEKNSLTSEIPVISIKGPIGPAVSEHLTAEINVANSQNTSPLIIITLDTPGGLVSSLRDINQTILASNIPVACLVYPKGARAASAGTYILYACHVAAMAKATTIGAATPVQIGPSAPSPEKSVPADKSEADKPSNITASAMEKKVLNDAIAYIRSLAQLRGRNEKWAELAVKEAATLTAREALELNVIDLIAESPTQLVSRLDGTIITFGETKIPLKLKGAVLVDKRPSWQNQFIATITNPNIAYILMIIGVYGLLLEFYSPGVGLAGVTGAISLIIALYAFQMLPLSYAGLALLLLGIVLLITESMLPSFGIFGLGGITAFVVGSIFLFDTAQPQFQVSRVLIASVAVLSTLFFLFALGFIWRAKKNPVVTGPEAIIGANATVIYDFEGQGFVNLNGERWNAISPIKLSKGQAVTVIEINGLSLLVSLVEAKEASNGVRNQ